MTDPLIPPRAQPVVVDAYSGGRAEETPRRFDTGFGWIAVTDELERWCTPRGRWFRVRTENDDVVVLLCLAVDASWWLMT